ncbi:type IV minor pilin protein PilW [Thalassotalea insulae]|uniref:Type IV minor pilin protein PilW n=1 Tax=Thalassotalea insulae TaxID=2056778 RepID=A0ABQ6GME0_9GAMM|nr:PilW family protein [Thalassotalea insulae]GLX77163.1 type IV minor pilin protein PilW [Thalassotalea insulae]
MNRIKGFTVVELLISLAVGLGLLAGVLSVFVGMKTTTSETSSFGELQENGRFALNLLTHDLLRQDFWGDYTGTFDLSSLNGVVQAAPTNDCVGQGINNATFPVAAGHFRTLWGITVDSSNTNPLGCFANANPAKEDSDIVQIKRVLGDPVLLADVDDERYYLMTNIGHGEIFDGGGATPPTIDNSQIWEYQHHIYYVTEQSQGSDKVPVLMQGRLTDSMVFSPVVDGIEMIRFMYGVDTSGNGMVNSYISADEMNNNPDYWDNAATSATASVTSSIIAVKIYVLARSVLPDNKYSNTNTYHLGNLEYTVDDNYRRLLFSATVTLFNARIDSWPPQNLPAI